MRLRHCVQQQKNKMELKKTSVNRRVNPLPPPCIVYPCLKKKAFWEELKMPTFLEIFQFREGCLKCKLAGALFSDPLLYVFFWYKLWLFCINL